jgi:flagellar protein FliO/FliZ
MIEKMRLHILVSLFCLSHSFTVSAAELATNKNLDAAKMTPVESLLPMLLGLIVILFVIFVLAILVKKVTGLNIVSSNIKVIESQSLGAKEKLVIVEIQQQQYVLGVTAHSINQICQLQNRIEKKSSVLPFDKIMKQFLQPNTSKKVEDVIAKNGHKKSIEVK